MKVKVHMAIWAAALAVLAACTDPVAAPSGAPIFTAERRAENGGCETTSTWAPDSDEAITALCCWGVTANTITEPMAMGYGLECQITECEVPDRGWFLWLDMFCCSDRTGDPHGFRSPEGWGRFWCGDIPDDETIPDGAEVY
uniref:Lipoprotein n=1 Tax=viral metagenome TaxID=1070528 RepID=A0A6M3KPD7_9ZZZZ